VRRLHIDRGAWSFLLLALTTTPLHAHGQDLEADDDPPTEWSFELGGSIAFELRSFVDGPKFEGQFDTFQSSFVFEPELRWETEDRDDQIMFIPFYRYDAQDDERTHFDVREAYWRHVDGDWELLVGVNRVFWGVTESRHLVNVINQIDAVEDIDEEDFLGQPMVQLGYESENGRFDLFLMTGFRPRTFAGRDGRLRAPLPVDDDAEQYESSLEEWRPEFALRYSHFFGDIDLGLHIFHGTGREPELMPDATGLRLVPRYSVINQFGVDFQYTQDALLWKFEGIVREGQGDTFAAAVAGFEYTLYQIGDSDADLGLLVEGLYDGRDDDVFPTIYDEDLFLGARLALNDVEDTSLLIGLVTDFEEGPETMRLEFERRLSDNWKFELEAQVFFQNDPKSAAVAFEQDSFIGLRFARFF